MSNIYLIRHAESIANTKGIYQGQTHDTNLSYLGEKQAAALGGYFVGINIAHVYASPLKRTYTTALALSGIGGVDVQKENQIIETNHGLWEGKNKRIIQQTWPETYSLWFKDPSKVAFPNGESFKETQKRVMLWWEETIIGSEGSVVIVSHDNILRIIIASILGLNLGKIWHFHLHPAAVSVVEVLDGVSKLVLLNDTNHLKDLETDLSVHAL